MALNSLFTGLSGLQVHQTRTNVVADNIANINTTAFKRRRATFQDLLAQTLKEAKGPTGTISGVNPVQAGTGVRMKSIDTIFNQGSIQATGRSTDLAIEGKGFFILSDGVSRFYTRDGAFDFDSLGRLINPSSGMVVQGNLADADGEFGATTGLQNIQVDLNQEIPGAATEQISLSGNVDPGSISALSASTKFTSHSSVTTDGFPASLTADQQIEILISTPEKLTTGLITVPDALYPSIESYVDALNAAIAGNERLAGQVIVQTDATNPANVQLQTTFGGPDVQLALADVATAPGGLDALGFAAPTETSANFPGKTVTLGNVSNTVTDTATALNDLAQVGAHLSSGDILRFSGTRSDGTSFNGSFTYDPNGDGTLTTIGDFLNSLAGEFGDNVTASLDPTGKLQLQDTDNNTVTGFTLKITLDAGASDNLSSIANRSGLIDEDGLKQHKITTFIFDSQGRSHTLTVNLAETPVANRWNWNVTIDNQNPTKGGAGTAIFDEDGTIRSFVPIEGEGTLLEYTPDGEVLPMKLDLSGISQPDRGVQGLTQFASPSTADVVDQDGRAPGRLDAFFIRGDGVIEGRFTNGVTLNLARINLANFDNAGGLRRIGGNLFAETENTGNPLIEIATQTIESEIVAESLELSNVDLAQELTELIIAQRGFQANARVISTTDQILVETVNLKQ